MHEERDVVVANLSVRYTLVLSQIQCTSSNSFHSLVWAWL